MWRRRRVVAGVAALAVAGGLAWFWLRDGGGSRRDDATGPGAGSHGAARLTGRGSRRVPRWLGQPGLEARHVAGRVTYKGSPVAGATVRLELPRELRSAMPPVTVTTTPDGRFDFGMQMAAELLVMASAPGRAPDGAQVDLRDPTRAPPPDRLELALTDCARTIFGKVHDHGGAIAGATVRAATHEESIATTSTGSDGDYLLCIGPGEAMLSITADGYASVEVEIEIDPGSAMRVRRDVELSPEALVMGLVLGPDDQPVAGAFVHARPTEMSFAPTKSATAMTGDDGRFSLGGIPPGRYALDARDVGLRTGESVEVIAAVAAGEDVTLRLLPMVRVRGRVVESGKPVAGARIAHRTDRFLRVNRSIVPFAQAVSQPDGTFVLDAVPAGTFAIAVENYEVLAPATAEAVAPETEVVVEVARKARVSGRVMRDGKPVGSATVRMKGARGSWGGWASTKADGAFDIGGLDPGSYELQANSDTAFARAKTLEISKGQRLTGVDIELDLAGTIAGMVVDQHRKPVAGVAVVFEMGPQVDWGFATTQEDGTFVAGAMSGGGTYKVTVKPERRSSIELRPAPGTSFPSVSLPDGRSQANGIQIAVQLDRKQISGLVVGADGKPAPDVKVAAYPPLQSSLMMRFTQPVAEVTTGTDGTFVLGELLSGDYTVRASTGTGADVVENKVAAGRTDLRLRLLATGSIEGKLVGFGERARVTASGLASPVDDFAGRVHGDRFTITALPADSYIVSARDGARSDEAHIEVIAGKIASVTLTSRGSATVSGRAVDLVTRAPLAGLECSDSGAWKDSGPRAATDTQGRFELGVPAGRLVSVRCMSPTDRFRTMGSASVELEAGTSKEIQVEVIVMHRAERMLGDLGLHLQPGPPVVVYKVDPGGAAERAGVQAEDRVMKVDGVNVAAFESRQVLMLMLDHAIGEKVELVLGRGGQEVAVSVEVVERGRSGR